MPADPIRDFWNRVRGLGRKVEEEIYDFTEEEEHEEPRGRNTLMVLINGFFTIWKASQGTIAERTFGMLGFAGLLWLIVGDRGLGVRRSPLRVVASKSHRDAATDDYIGKYEVADMKSAGSSLKFCLVATGEADLYPRLGRTMEWDTAAGHAVLAGAGGEVVRFDDHSPLGYGKPGFENPFFIALAPGIELAKP